MEDFDFVKGVGPNATREVIAAFVKKAARQNSAEVCCICRAPATRQRGTVVFFPFCDEHYAATE